MLCTIQAIVLGPANNYVPVATLVKVLLNWPLVTYLRSAVKSIFFKVKFSLTVSCTVSDFLHRQSQILHITVVSFRVLWWSEFLFDIWCWFLTYFFAQARVSLKRIQEFLGREELDPNSVQKTRCKFTLSSLILGTLSKDDDDASENVGKKMNLRSFKLNRVCLDPLNMSNTGDFSWSEILKNLIQVKKDEGKFVVVCPRPPQIVKLGGFTS